MTIVSRLALAVALAASLGRGVAAQSPVGTPDPDDPLGAIVAEVIGSNRFPTNLDVTIPFQYESRVRLTQPLFNASILANHSLARHTRDGQRLQHATAARSLAAQAQS